jgi:hypothetical protein
VIHTVYFCSAFAEQSNGWNGGATLGFTVYMGNKTDRVGVFAGVWLCYDFVQVNSGVRLYYSFKNLGTPGKYWECDSYAGGLLSCGKRDSIRNPFISSVSNQTMRPFSMAYSYNIYAGHAGTNQKTGTVAFQFNKISIISENDLWGDNKDRFRTASASVQYRRESAIFGVSVILWTGESGASIKDTNYPARNRSEEHTSELQSPK